MVCVLEKRKVSLMKVRMDMFSMTPQEKLVVLFVCLTFVAGSALEQARLRWPAVARFLTQTDRPEFYPKVDINRASAGELERVPFIGEKTAGAIVRRRERDGLFSSTEDVLSVPGVLPKNYERFRHYLLVRDSGP